jgi:SAM-dependent methyltransferase
MGESSIRQRVKTWCPDPALALWRAVRRRLGRVKNHRDYQRELAGKAGLEVGGPSPFFRDVLPVYPVVSALDGVNFSTTTMWEGEIAAGARFEYAPGQAGLQFIAEATDLHAIATGSYQFLLSSNCLEHVANPLKALREWMRVVQPGGLLLLVLPNQAANFDHRRPVTRFEHLLDDELRDVGEDDLTHLEEILTLHDLARDPWAGGRENFIRRSRGNLRYRGLHHHVFDQNLIAQMVAHLGLMPVLRDTTPSDFIVLCRTPAAAP